MYNVLTRIVATNCTRYPDDVFWIEKVVLVFEGTQYKISHTILLHLFI